MKKFLILAVAAFAMVGCAIKDTPTISFYEESYTVSSKGGELIIPVSSTGIDAVIISDLGLFSIAKEVAPELEIHISTQANNVNYESAKKYC